MGLLGNTAVQDAGQRLDDRNYQTHFKFRKMEVKTTIMWAVYRGKRLLALDKKRENVLCHVGINHECNKWALMFQYGLDCRKVRVTIEESNKNK